MDGFIYTYFTLNLTLDLITWVYESVNIFRKILQKYKVLECFNATA